MCSIFARVPAIAAVLCSCVTAAEAGAEIWEFESRPGVECGIVSVCCHRSQDV
jgi:hypothetical protein